MAQQQEVPKDYTQRYSNSGGAKQGKSFADKMPDETIHLPPIALFLLGGIGAVAGVLANIWQCITTFIAFWSMFNPKATPVDFQRQPAIMGICTLIAFSFQLALLFLVFRLDKKWKQNKAAGESAGKAARDAVVEVIQQTDLILIWSLLGFVVDTVGDYTFVSLFTASLDATTGIFLIFIYAAALYSLSTIGFARSLEYLWAGFASIARHVASK